MASILSKILGKSPTYLFHVYLVEFSVLDLNAKFKVTLMYVARI